MKILTLNTHSWLEAQPLEKLSQLANQILKEEYALIALQEINQRIDSSPITPDHFFHPTENQAPIHEDNFAYLLVQKLTEQGQTYHWSWAYNHIGYSKYHEGVALLSKEPISPKAVVVSKEQDVANYKRRAILLGQTKLAGQTIIASSCHYSWWTESPEDGFTYEWQQTENYLSPQTLPLLFMGDFNTPAFSLGYQQVANSPLHLQDSFTAANEIIGEHTVEAAIDGWGDNQELLRIDYLFISKNISVKTYEVVFDGQNSPVISDHFGLSATIQF